MKQTDYGHETFIVQDGPWDVFIRARVMCSDGMVRATMWISPAPDTPVSIPAHIKIRKRSVSGFIIMETARGGPVSESNPTVLKFVATGKNAGILPKGSWKEEKESGK